jgi:replication factor C small subunit
MGQDKLITDAYTWQEGMPNLLFYGVAGVGKTAAAGVIANYVLQENKEGNFLELNASDDRRLEVVRTTIKDVATSMKSGDVPHKIILLDEMDGMTPDAQNALKRLMERYSSNVRFIITCNHRHKIIYPLQSRCANYRFNRLKWETIEWVLKSIIDKENLNCDHSDKEMESFIKAMQGDLRRAITHFQASVNSNTPLTIQINNMMEPYNNILDAVLNSNHNLALEKTHTLLDTSVDMKTVCVNLHSGIIENGFDIDMGTKFKLLKVIGEAEWRSNSMTPKVLASWMIGQMI